MKTKNSNVDAATINYQFTAIPTNFIYLMDNDCFKLFAILLQKETYWNNKGMLKNGYFIKSISELAEELNLKNRKDVHTIIEALHRKNIISIQVQPRKYNTAKFKLNWNKINEYLDMSIYDLMEFEERIVKLNRNETITYTDNVTSNVTDNVTNNDTKCNTTINNINNLDKIDKLNNIYNNKNNILNKIEEKENNIINDITKEKEINLENNIKLHNSKFELKEVNQTRELKEKFYSLLETSIEKLNNISTKDEFKEKSSLLNIWIKNNSYFKLLEEQENYDEIDSISSTLQEHFKNWKPNNIPTDETDNIPMVETNAKSSIGFSIFGTPKATTTPTFEDGATPWKNPNNIALKNAMMQATRSDVTHIMY